MSGSIWMFSDQIDDEDAFIPRLTISGLISSVV